jgi:hypothetical protein
MTANQWETIMFRQYYAQRARGGDNPLRVGVIPIGASFYLQDEAVFRSRHNQAPIFRTLWTVEAFLNGTVGAARRNPETGMWDDAYIAGRSDTALVRSLRDRRYVRKVAINTLILHDDLSLWKDMPGYPSLPDTQRLRAARSGTPQVKP